MNDLAVAGTTLFAATGGAGIYRSSDYGTHWFSFTDGYRLILSRPLLYWIRISLPNTRPRRVSFDDAHSELDSCQHRTGNS